jgi:hypothetical protein
MYEIKDVKGDGSCFFRSLYLVLVHHGILKQTLIKICELPRTTDFATITESRFVSIIRHLLSEYSLKSKITSNAYKHILDASKDRKSYKLILEFYPEWFVKLLDTIPENVQDFRLQYSQAILKKSSWISELEILLLQHLFTTRLKTKIHIFANKAPSKKFKFELNTIYLYNLNEVHYNAVLPNLKTKQNRQTTSIQQTSLKSKVCPDNKILNSKTNRCVLKTSCKGYELIAKFYTS